MKSCEFGELMAAECSKITQIYEFAKRLAAIWHYLATKKQPNCHNKRCSNSRSARNEALMCQDVAGERRRLDEDVPKTCRRCVQNVPETCSEPTGPKANRPPDQPCRRPTNQTIQQHNDATTPTPQSPLTQQRLDPITLARRNARSD